MITLFVFGCIVAFIVTYVIAFISILGFIALDIGAFIFIIYLLIKFIKKRRK